MTGTGVALRLVGITVFAVWMAVLIRWERQTWPKQQEETEHRTAVNLVVLYLVMMGFAYLIYRADP